MKSKINIWVILIAASVSLASSCRPDPVPPVTEENKGTLKIHFNLNYDGQPFSFNTPYSEPIHNYRIQTELIRFLMYNLTLKSSTGESILKDAELIDFTSNHYELSYSLSPGSFDGLKFGIGVGDSSVNHGDPALFNPEHALSYNVSADMHWTWNTGYIFLKYEGRADTTTSGSGALDQLFALHTGDDPLYGEVNFYSSPFTISENTITDFHINVDVAKFLYNASDTIDIKTENATHTNNTLSVKFAQIYLDAFSVQ